MLVELELRDFAIVDELRLSFPAGLTALTGETGAGKSILVDALALLAGNRADSAMVRAGCDSALVQGIFEQAALTSAARRLQAAGRSTARIDGELVTVAELSTRVGSLLAIHGQHAAQALGQSDAPLRQLDRLLDAEHRQLLERYRSNYQERLRIRRELAELRRAERERERRLDVLRFQLSDIDGAKLRAGEEERLLEAASSLRHGERIVLGASRAFAALSESERSVLSLLAEAARELSGAARHHPPLQPLAAELDDALAAVQATTQEVESFLSDFEADPAELDRVEARLARLAELKRKYGETIEAVLAFRQEAAAELERLERAEADAAGLEARALQLEATLAADGGAVGAARRRAAERLEAEVAGLLAQLGMGKGRFLVRLEPLAEPGPHGLEEARFAFSANPGEPVRELAAVASGGELARVMLALDVVTGSELPTLVFDEVDAGTGGQAARAVGALLRRLARDRQVLVVTHLPQVAAFADCQYFVEKLEKAGRTVTRVRRLEPREREQELARMLSGAVTEASLQNARELLQAAAG